MDFSYFSSNQATTDNSSTREAIKSFRVFRVFRPIKAINKSKQLKVCDKEITSFFMGMYRQNFMHDDDYIFDATKSKFFVPKLLNLTILYPYYI